MTDIESLRRLTEAVETAGADIAPTYLEYVQLSFAIATDCGEAGREFFHRLCRVSPKYQREHAERVFSNALHTQRGEVHLGTAFHLAEATGVSICIEEMPKHPTGTKGTAGTARKFPPHTGAHNKVGNDNISDDKEGEEELLPGSEPQHQLPTFPENDWPEFLQRIIKAGSNPIQHDIMLLGALTALGACMSRHVRCLYGGKYHHPSLQCFVVAPSASGKGILSYIRLLVEPIHDEIRKEVAIQMKAYKKRKPSMMQWEKNEPKRRLHKCPLTGCSSFRATTPVRVSYKTSWTPTEPDLSAKRKRTLFPPPSDRTTVIGAIPCAKRSTTTACPTTAAPTRNTGK